MKNLKFIPLAIAVLAMTMVACKKEDVQPTNSNGTSQTFKVKMTDSPGDYASLDVEITKVEAYLQNDGWITLNSESQVVSVLDLTNGAETTLASRTGLEAGLYTKLRLTFGSQGQLGLLASGSGAMLMADLNWGSSQQVEIEINEQLSANAGVEVLLDFHVAQSIYQQAQDYFINPTITVIEDASTGIQGEVEGSANAAITLTDGMNTFSTYINAQGQFLIRGMEDGMYQMIIQPAEDNLSPQTVNGVVVVRGAITQVGTIQF